MWGYARSRNALWGSLLTAVLLLDLVTWSLAFNWGWRDFVSHLAEKMQDPPAVQFIKAREKDLNSFRVASAPLDFGSVYYHELNLPNVSIVRGLQSVNGYDALRLLRMTAVAGDMSLGGVPGDRRVLDAVHRGYDLLNVKYLLREKSGKFHKPRKVDNSFPGRAFDFRHYALCRGLIAWVQPAN